MKDIKTHKATVKAYITILDYKKIMDIAQNHLHVTAMGHAKYLVHHKECICLPPGNRIWITNLQDQ